MLFRNFNRQLRKLVNRRDTVKICMFAMVFVSMPQFWVRAADSVNPTAVLQDLKSFREMGSVLMIAAHPDDENTQLITYLARGRGYRMAYLSVTRGDGGQNLLGGEFGDELGVIRTQELLAARRLDGGQQFFTRAVDFGFSKDVNEALRIWDHEQILGDVVRVIRTFQPDVIVTRFSPQASNTHGQHTASAVLAVEAFKLAGDPKAYPEQLTQLKVWQPKRILLNGGGFGRGGNAAPPANGVRIEAGGNDAVLGIPLTEIANQSRAMHKSQGFGGFAGRGGGAGPRFEQFQLLGGEPATKDIMDGVDLTWGRFSGGEEIGKLADEAIQNFDPSDLSKSVPTLLKIKSLLSALPELKDSRMLQDKMSVLTKSLQACLGLSVETRIGQAEIVPGENLAMTHQVTVAGKVPVKWVGMYYAGTAMQERTPVTLQPNKAETLAVTQKLDADTPLSQPYWLRENPAPGMHHVDQPSLIGEPENPPVYPVSYEFEVLGQRLRIADEPVYVTQEKEREQRRRLDVVSPVTIRFADDVRIFAPGSTRTVDVELTCYRAGAKGTVELDAKSGWKVQPASQAFELNAVGDRKTVTFQVTAPNEAASVDIAANAVINGKRYKRSRVDIRYDHIPALVLQPLAQSKAISLDLQIRGKKVGYVAGAGDSVADAMVQMGYEVVPITVEEISPEKLQGLDAVVIGVRAFNVHRDLLAKMPVLHRFVEEGGNLIEQYNREGMPANGPTPFEMQIANLRITDENAPVRFLVPDHPVLNTPNKITVNDFLGWVQERGIYFPNRWSQEFTPILASNDPNEQSLEGGLLVAKHGKGHVVYTSLVFFRQLPAGVPGAYRLFANIVSLGK